MDLNNFTDFSQGNDDANGDLSTTEPPYQVPKQAYFVMSGIVIHVGLVFNTLAFIVLVLSVKLRRTLSGMYLIALSVADSTFLFGELLRWLSSGYQPFGIDINYMNDNLFACRFTNFIRYGGKLASAWLTVAITTERLLLVTFPMKHARLWTKFTTRVTICAIFFASFLLGAYPLWSLEIQIKSGRFQCNKDDTSWYEIGSWVSLRVGSLLLPGVIVFVMTGIIIYFLTHAQKKRERKLSSRRTFIQRQDTVEVKKMALEKQLTVMLVTVAVVFIVLRLPYAVTYYLNEYKDQLWPDGGKWFKFRIYAANKVADTVATLNYAINFFLYYICGNVFRKELKLVCTCAVCGSSGLTRQRSNQSSVPMTAVTGFYSRSKSQKDSSCPSPASSVNNKRFF